MPAIGAAGRQQAGIKHAQFAARHHQRNVRRRRHPATACDSTIRSASRTDRQTKAAPSPAAVPPRRRPRPAAAYRRSRRAPHGSRPADRPRRSTASPCPARHPYRPQATPPAHCSQTGTGSKSDTAARATQPLFWSWANAEPHPRRRNVPQEDRGPGSRAPRECVLLPSRPRRHLRRHAAAKSASRRGGRNPASWRASPAKATRTTLYRKIAASKSGSRRHRDAQPW